MPSWSSAVAHGDVGPAATNPAGTMWAGAWNLKKEKEVTRAAVVVIDLENKTSQRVRLGEGFSAASLVWKDDKSFRVLLVDSDKPSIVTRSKLVTCRVSGDTADSTDAWLEADVASILTWPAGSDLFAGRIGGTPTRIALLNAKGKPVGKEAGLEVPDSARFYPLAALSPDGKSFVFGVEKSEIGGTQIFYLTDSNTGATRELFTSKDVPGIVDGMWLSQSGVLIVASERGKVSEVVFDLASGKMIQFAKGKSPVEVARNWPAAPARMLFVTYEGGYQLDLATGKTRRIVKFDTSDRDTSHWRTEINGGRLYSRKDGDYTSVSYTAGAVDIRVIGKDGKKMQPILQRR
jgi:hypothetical protein